jgi:hypothetical protein
LELQDSQENAQVYSVLQPFSINQLPLFQDQPDFLNAQPLYEFNSSALFLGDQALNSTLDQTLNDTVCSPLPVSTASASLSISSYALTAATELQSSVHTLTTRSPATRKTKSNIEITQISTAKVPASPALTPLSSLSTVVSSSPDSSGSPATTAKPVLNSQSIRTRPQSNRRSSTRSTTELIARTVLSDSSNLNRPNLPSK